MHIRHSTQLKLSAKLIKCVKSRVHYNATGLVCAVYEPAKPILINAKTAITRLARNASASRYKRELLRKRCKIRCFYTELLSACCSARASPRSKKSFKVK